MIFNTHLTTHNWLQNYSFRKSDTLVASLGTRHPGGLQANIHTKHPYILKIKVLTAYMSLGEAGCSVLVSVRISGISETAELFIVWVSRGIP